MRFVKRGLGGGQARSYGGHEDEAVQSSFSTTCVSFFWVRKTASFSNVAYADWGFDWLVCFLLQGIGTFAPWNVWRFWGGLRASFLNGRWVGLFRSNEFGALGFGDRIGLGVFNKKHYFQGNWIACLFIYLFLSRIVLVVAYVLIIVA